MDIRSHRIRQRASVLKNGLLALLVVGVAVGTSILLLGPSGTAAAQGPSCATASPTDANANVEECDAGAFETLEVLEPVAPVYFSPIAPSRILDTRPGFVSAGNPDDGVDVPVGAGESRTVQVAGLVSAGVPVEASAVAVHVTSVGPTANSFLTVWASGERPDVASKNFGITAGGPFGYAGLTNDLLIVPVGPEGTIQVYNDAGNVDLVIDIVGYFAPRAPNGQLECDAGVLVGDWCQIQEAAPASCPDGYTADASLGGLCAFFEPAEQLEPTCPEGSQGTPDECYITVARGPGAVSCVEGTLQSLNCVIVGDPPILGPPLQCADGFGLLEGECIRYEDAIVVPAECPDDSVEDEAGDCRKPVAQAEGAFFCSDPQAALNGTSCVFVAGFVFGPCPAQSELVGSACVSYDVPEFVADGTQSGDGFSPVVTSRILDTRPGFASAGNPDDGVDVPVGAGQTRTVQVADLVSAGVPAEATAVAIHVTSVGPTANSFLTVWPGGERPDTASKNFGVTAGGSFGYAGLTNDVLIVPVSAAGTIDVYNEAGAVDLVIDIVGYFAPLGDSFSAVVPSRILDTRPGFSSAGNPLDGLDVPVGAGESRTVQVAGLGSADVPVEASAVAIHVTSVGPTANSFLTMWPGGVRPEIASKNFGITAGGPFGYAGLTNDLLIVPVSPTGTIDVYNEAGAVDLVVDIVGYFAASEIAE